MWSISAEILWMQDLNSLNCQLHLRFPIFEKQSINWWFNIVLIYWMQVWTLNCQLHPSIRKHSIKWWFYIVLIHKHPNWDKITVMYFGDCISREGEFLAKQICNSKFDKTESILAIISMVLKSMVLKSMWFIHSLINGFEIWTFKGPSVLMRDGMCTTGIHLHRKSMESHSCLNVALIRNYHIIIKRWSRFITFLQ